jgi:hypothetical protein
LRSLSCGLSELFTLAQNRETLRSGDFAQRFFFSVAATVFDLVGSKSGDFAQRIAGTVFDLVGSKSGDFAQRENCAQRIFFCYIYIGMNFFILIVVVWRKVLVGRERIRAV